MHVVSLDTIDHHQVPQAVAAEILSETESNQSVTLNETLLLEKNNEYVFDRTDVRVIFIMMYTLVFCCCFFGNLLVILVVTLSRRLRSITNFFLANLALADLCVGIFCVIQNLSIYLMPNWIFGDFLCKMYQFTHSLSYTASIFILVVICTERYFAIIHPITCKQILTPKRLRMVIIGVWVTSAVYSAPKLIWVQMVSHDFGEGQIETICIAHRQKYDSEMFDMINFGLLYVLPLCVMTVLYSRIAVALWRSSRGAEREVSRGAQQCRVNNCTRHLHMADTQISVENSSGNGNYVPMVATRRTRTQGSQDQQFSHLSHNVLRARRGVIRMLIIVVLTFALCNLPLHARKMWQYWCNSYDGGSSYSHIFTCLTFLITYFNSGINPFLYAFLSRNFRKGMKELLFCSCKGLYKNNANGLFNQQRNNQQNSILRRSSTRSTRMRCSSVTLHTNITDT